MKPPKIRSGGKRAKRGRVAFRKYTNLAVAMDMLQNKHISLLDPDSWKDKNDAWFMQEYKDIIGATTLLATCFAETEDTHHHWRVFSDGTDGVCIEFDKDRILSAFDGVKGIKKDRVRYFEINTLRRRARIAPEELPFLKRHPYKPECEYRVIYVEHSGEQLETKSFRIDLQWIKRITLSPWLPAALRKAVIKTLRKIPDCEKLEIFRSTQISNLEWRALTSKART